MEEYDYPDAPSQETRPSVVAELDEQVVRLSKTVEALGGRLRPVLGPDYANEKVSKDSAPAPIASEIRNVLNRLAGETNRIRGLMERLEV